MVETKNILWIDLLRVVAMFGVVLLHAAASVLYQYGKIPMSYWWTANIYYTVFIVCVPLFFMISGYLLLEKSEKISFFITKRITKVVIPLVIWSIVYLIWQKIVIVDFDISFRSFYSIINSPTYYHLWFIYALVGVYIFIPILRIFIQNSSESIKYYFVIIWFFSESILSLFEKITGLERQVDFITISGFVGYFVLGYIIGHLNISKKLFNISKIILILTYVFTAYGIYFLSTRNGTFNNYFYGYLGSNIIFLSVIFFILFKYAFQDSKVFNYKLGVKIIHKLSSASLGIFLIHPIFLYHLNNQGFGFSLSATSGNPILFIPITAIVTFLLSFFVIRILQKIPVIKYCVP